MSPHSSDIAGAASDFGDTIGHAISDADMAGPAIDFIVDSFIERAEEAKNTSLFDGTKNNPDKSSDYNMFQNLFDLFGSPNGPTFQ